MQTTYATTIYQTPKGNDVVNVHSIWAICVKIAHSLFVNPRWHGTFCIFSSPVIKSFVSHLKYGVCVVFVAFPRIDVISSRSILKISRSAFSVFFSSARFAFVTYPSLLFVIFTAGFINTAFGANLGDERLRASFHNTYILSELSSVGDLKQRELREKRVTPIRSQAPQECGEGSETRAWSPDRTVKPHERAARELRDEIVRPAQLNVQKHGIKSPCDNTVTTIESRTGILADNTSNNNALLRRLKEKGNSVPFSGGWRILQEIMYTDSSTINVDSYSGYDVLNTTPNSPISAAQFPIAQYAGSISMSGLEELQNAGKEQIIDLMEGRVKVTESQLANRIDYDLYQDGTGNASKNLTGLAAAVPDDPTTGTYGNISRDTWTFWRSVKYSGVTDGGAAVSSANIQGYMEALVVQLVLGNESPDLIVASNDYYRFYNNSLTAIQRVTSNGSGSAGAGFAGLKFFGGGKSADVVLGGGINGDVNTAGTDGGATSSHMWMLNTNYIHWRPHRRRNFVPIGGDRQPVNQDAIIKFIGFAGNLTMSGSRYQGVLIA